MKSALEVRSLKTLFLMIHATPHSNEPTKYSAGLFLEIFQQRHSPTNIPNIYKIYYKCKNW